MQHSKIYQDLEWLDGLSHDKIQKRKKVFFSCSRANCATKFSIQDSYCNLRLRSLYIFCRWKVCKSTKTKQNLLKQRLQWPVLFMLDNYNQKRKQCLVFFFCSGKYIMNISIYIYILYLYIIDPIQQLDIHNIYSLLLFITALAL